MAKDLKLTATLEDKVSPQLKKSADKLRAESIKNNDAVLKEAKRSADQLLKIQNQAAIAEASLVENRFDRRIAIEKTKSAQSLLLYKTSNEKQEAEARRSAAVLKRIEMDKANFASTPFQTLLGHLGKLGVPGGGLIRESGEKNEALKGILGVEGGAGHAATGLSAAESGAGASIAGLAAPIAIASGALVGLGFVMEHTAEIAKKQREEERGLESSLMASGRESTLSKEKLEAYALSLSETTNFSKGAAESALGMLLPFRTLSNREMPMLLQASANLAAKMGTDLPTAAHQLGLAFEDPEKAAKLLRTAGITLTEQEKKQIASWDAMGQAGKSHEFLFKRLSDSLGNYAKDTANQTDILGHQWEEFEGKIGRVALKVMDSFASMFLHSSDKNLSLEQAANKKLEDEEILAIKMRFQHGTDQTGSAMDKMYAEIAALKKKHTEKETAEEKKAADFKPSGNGETDAQKTAREAREKKAAEAQVKFLEDRQTALKSSYDRDIQARKKHVKDVGDQADAEDKLQKQRWAAQDNLKMGQENDPIKKLALKQKQEEDLISDHQTKMDVQMLHEIEMKQAVADAESQLFQAKMGYVEQYGQAFSDMVGIIGGKSKVAFAIQKAIALGEIAVHTASAIVADNVNPLTWWKIPWDIGLGAAQAAVVAGTALKGFESGGYTGAGGRRDVAGLVHAGEMVWSQDDVRRAGGPAKAEQIRQGSGSSFSPVVNIHLSGSATTADAQMVARATTEQLTMLARNIDRIKYENIRT